MAEKDRVCVTFYCKDCGAANQVQVPVLAKMPHGFGARDPGEMTLRKKIILCIFMQVHGIRDDCAVTRAHVSKYLYRVMKEKGLRPWEPSEVQGDVSRLLGMGMLVYVDRGKTMAPLYYLSNRGWEAAVSYNLDKLLQSAELQPTGQQLPEGSPPSGPGVQQAE